MIHDSTRKIPFFVMKCCCKDPTFPFVLCRLGSWIRIYLVPDILIGAKTSSSPQPGLLYLYIFGACLATIVVIVPRTARPIELSTNLREVSHSQ